METTKEIYHHELGKVKNCVFKLRDDLLRRKERVRIGCGAGFGGDRPLAALKLLQRVEELDYLVLECLAERTLADRYQLMLSGGKGYDPRISEWMECLLPLAMERGVRIITNMGAVDPLGAQQVVLDVASSLGFSITVAVAYEVSPLISGFSRPSHGAKQFEGGQSTYLGAAPIVECLERYEPHVVITSRTADAALFIAPMIFELGWDWNDFGKLAQGALAGHLLECGCQLTGGYFMHPEDDHRRISFQQLLELSLPYAEINHNGEVHVGKADGSGGILNLSTCSEQLLYEVGDPASYITPDVNVDIRDVFFCPLSADKVSCHGAKPSDVCIPNKLLKLVPVEAGWKAWGEISYGGLGCLKRAEAAEYLVKSWMDEACPGSKNCILSYVIGHDSLKARTFTNCNSNVKQTSDVRLRMDGLFNMKDHGLQFENEFIALYTNGPAGGGGICTGHKKEIVLQKELVERETVLWRTEKKQIKMKDPGSPGAGLSSFLRSNIASTQPHSCFDSIRKYGEGASTSPITTPAPFGVKIPLYQVAHSRAGDKGNDMNFSIIPHHPEDIDRLRMVITVEWVKVAVSALLEVSSFLDSDALKLKDDMLSHVKVEIYDVRGICSLNIVVRSILDGGVNSSRRIDRHGKTISDLILSQEIELVP